MNKLFYQVKFIRLSTCALLFSMAWYSSDARADVCDSKKTNEEIFLCVSAVWADDTSVGFTKDFLNGATAAKGYQVFLSGISEKQTIANRFLPKGALLKPRYLRQSYAAFTADTAKKIAPNFSGSNVALAALLFIFKEAVGELIADKLGGKDSPEFVLSKFGVDQACAVIGALPPFSLPGTFLISLTIQETTIAFDATKELIKKRSELDSLQQNALVGTLSTYAAYARSYANGRARGLTDSNRLMQMQRQTLDKFLYEVMPALSEPTAFEWVFGAYLELKDFPPVARRLASARLAFSRSQKNGDGAWTSTRTSLLAIQDFAIESKNKDMFYAMVMLRIMLFSPSDLQKLDLPNWKLYDYCNSCTYGY